MTWEEGRAQEDEFFATTKPMDLFGQEIFGYREFDSRSQIYLVSKMIMKRYLSKAILVLTQSLPKLKDALKKHCKAVERRILELPPPVSPETAQYTLLALCRDFVDEIRIYRG